MQKSNKYTSVGYALSCITIYRHVSVASATVTGVEYKNANNVQKLHKIAHNFTKFHKILQNCTKFYKIAHNFT